MLFVGCAKDNSRELSKNCKLHNSENGSYELTVNWEFINDTVSRIEKVGWVDDWVYVYGVDNKSGKKGWIHIWDNVVVKKYGPIDKEQSYYGRKNAQMYEVDKAWNILK